MALFICKICKICWRIKVMQITLVMQILYSFVSALHREKIRVNRVNLWAPLNFEP